MGSTQVAGVVASEVPSYVSPSSNSSQGCQTGPPLQQVHVEDSSPYRDYTERKKLDPLSKIEALQIMFFRVLQRLGQSPEDIVVAKVLYRIHLATLIRAGESDLKRVNLRSDKARALASKQEALNYPKLDFSLRILLLGKTGVGKSATINSLFNQSKAKTNAFRPTTDQIQEITGTVNGVKITVIDTPGFLPSSPGNIRKNRKIMLSIRKHIRKSPPDVVLYLERLDTMNKDYSDFPLLRLIAQVFGSAMWFNTILVMTHGAAAPPEGPTGFPVGYESYVDHCTQLLQRYVQLSISDAKLENPVILAENHPDCRKNIAGEKILPNGQVWKQQLLLLCTCSKVLGDANSILGLQDSIELGPSNNSHLPILPHLLSSFLRQQQQQQQAVMTSDGAVDEVDECYSFSDDEEEDEYDQLPPIRVLTKTQFEKLTESQKNDYLDELDLRETLFLKKQLKEESRRRKNAVNEVSFDFSEVIPEAVPLSDMAVPPSFDSDSPEYRYRGVVTSDRWLWRPVLDPQGWDHDVGFDGVNLESTAEIKRNLTVSIAGQMRKDKHDFSIHSQCAGAYADPRGPTYSVGLEVRSSGNDNDMIYALHTHAKSRNLKYNIAGCGLSMTSFQNKCYLGTKLEDTLLIGKRVKLAMNAGRIGQVGGGGPAAYGGTLEATVRGRDYPVRSDKVSLVMTVLSFNK